eukprot:6177511-Pleurochrysis_carterae.AAC.3
MIHNTPASDAQSRKPRCFTLFNKNYDGIFDKWDIILITIAHTCKVMHNPHSTQTLPTLKKETKPKAPATIVLYVIQRPGKRKPKRCFAFISHCHVRVPTTD